MPIVQLVLQICIWLFDFLLSRYKILNISVYEFIFLSINWTVYKTFLRQLRFI